MEIEFNECKAIKRDRVGLIVELQSKKNKKSVITVSNVHLDYKSNQVRETQVLHLLKKLKEKGHPSSSKPLFLLGDFNSIPNSKTYDLIVNFSDCQVDEKKNENKKDFNNNKKKNNNKNPVQPSKFISSAYPSKTPHNELICTSFFQDNKHIDFIFHNSLISQVKSLLEPLMYYGSLPNDIHPSDHVPIKATFSISK